MSSAAVDDAHKPMLVCTATALEAHACALAFAQVPDAAGRFEVLQTGMGMAAAGRALKERLTRGRRPWAIVSTGLAGSVRRDIAVGTWVMATQVVAQDAVPIALSDGLGTLWQQAGIACRAQTFRTVDHITLQADPSAPHAAVVDMETYAWAEVAAQHRLPCAALRVISDTPDQPLPPFVSRLDCTRPKLRFAIAKSDAPVCRFLGGGASHRRARSIYGDTARHWRAYYHRCLEKNSGIGGPRGARCSRWRMASLQV